MAAPWQSAAMASAGGAVSLESRTEINVSGASSPDEVAAASPWNRTTSTRI